MERGKDGGIGSLEDDEDREDRRDRGCRRQVEYRWQKSFCMVAHQNDQIGGDGDDCRGYRWIGSLERCMESPVQKPGSR